MFGVATETCSRRDQFADDDVLFKTEEIVPTTLNSRASQNPDGVLERGC